MLRGDGVRQAAFGEGTGEIFLDDVGCTGTESYLSECPFTRKDNCKHREDAGVKCDGKY